jgi:phosphopantothenoylcysteine decarboxylase / phosphopantothenate---cysteine ligase
MHESLSSSPFFCKNILKLKEETNISFVLPRLEEGKQKIRTISELAIEISHYFNCTLTRNLTTQNKEKKNVAITYGGTSVFLDSVRCLTNSSTGSLGIELIKSVYAKGFSVTAFECNTSFQSPQFDNLTTIKCKKYSELLEQFERNDSGTIKNFETIYHLAAVSDFEPPKINSISHSEISQTKISSKLDKLELQLVPTKKLIELPNFQVIPRKYACKLTQDFSQNSEEKVKEFFIKNNLAGCLWNTSDSFSRPSLLHEGTYLTKDKENKFRFEKMVSKRRIAERFCAELL